MYDIFFTSTNFFLSLVFSVMVFLLTLIIFMAQLSCAGHRLMCPLLIWRLSGLEDACRQRGGVWGSFAVCSLWGWSGEKRDQRHYGGTYVTFSFFLKGTGKTEKRCRAFLSVSSPECCLKTIFAAN